MSDRVGIVVWDVLTGKDVKISVKVIPRSGRQKITIMGHEELKCYLQSPPEDGKANKELMELLAQELDIPKRSVAVIQGFTSRNKVVEIVGFASWDELVAALD